MKDYTNRTARTTTSAQQGEVAYNEGLRSYMLSVYNYMSGALGITGIVAYLAGTSPAFLSLMLKTTETGTSLTLLAYVVMFAPLGVVFYLSARMHKLSQKAAQAWFWAFSVLMGASLYYVFAMYTGVSIARVFFITAATFGAMSIYGYTTKRDLTGMGSFLMMGVFGLIIASIVNMFLQSSGLHFAISAIGVLIFIGLTAYDTQKIKNTYYQVAGSDMIGKAAIMGALSLYLDFINLFIMLLRFMGERR